MTGNPDGQVGLTPREERWVAERTFGCPVRSRRPVRDFERLTETSAARVKRGGTRRMVRRARGRRKFRYHRPTAA